MYVSSMRKSFKDSLKALEADIQHANTLASEFPREYDGACLQMRMSYSPAAHFFLFLVQWTDCQLAGSLGLLRILIYKVYVDGTTTMSTHERKSSIREFYAVIYPSLVQLESGVTDAEDKKQKLVCMERYLRKDDNDPWQLSVADIEREEECGICMEMNSKVVLPNCNHVMCLKCYRDWKNWNRTRKREEIEERDEKIEGRRDRDRQVKVVLSIACQRLAIASTLTDSLRHLRSQSCPFCRDGLKRVNSDELWIFTDSRDVVDMETLTRDNVRRLFMYIEKLPLVVPDSLFDGYNPHIG